MNWSSQCASSAGDSFCTRQTSYMRSVAGSRSRDSMGGRPSTKVWHERETRRKGAEPTSSTSTLTTSASVGSSFRHFR